MTQQPSIQVQAVLFNNNFHDIVKTVESLANAVRVARQSGMDLGNVSLIYGDASPEPVLTSGDVQTLQELGGNHLTVEYCHFAFNSGYGKGNNLLAMESTADYLVIMNPDIIVSPGYFIDTLAPFADERVGLVEARQTPVEHHKEYDVNTMATEWASGACFMMSTALFQSLGGFDCETFFMYCEDVDLSWRIRLAGYRLYYQPLSPVFHAKRMSVSGGWQPTTSEVYYTAISSILLPYKWSREDLAWERLQAYEQGTNAQRKAAAYVKQLWADGKLPAQIDTAHAVGKFNGPYYAENRFVL